MKKLYIIISIIFITLLICILFNILKINNILNIYESRNIIKGNINNSLLANNNLTIILKDAIYINEEKKLNIILDFKTINDIGLNNIMYDYLVYDNNNNILATSMVFTKRKSNIIRDNKITNNYILGFVNEKYNKNSCYEFSKHIINHQQDFRGVESSIGTISNNIQSIIKENNFSLKNINVIINNIEYKEINGKTTYLENVDFIFNIDL